MAPEEPVMWRQAPGEQSLHVGPRQISGQRALKGEITIVFEK
jgi:hypothetical protein